MIKAAHVGRSVVESALERKRPKFSREPYSLPMLSVDQLPQEAIRLVKELTLDGKEVDERVVRGASLSLVIEAAAQIVEAKPKSSRVVENPDSLNQMIKMTNAGARLHSEMESNDQDIVIVAARAAIAKRKSGSMANAQDWSDEQVLSWSRGTVINAHNRVGRLLESVRGYLGR